MCNLLPTYHKTMLIIMFYRKMFHARYSKKFEPLFQQWEKDVIKVGQEEDSFAVSIGFSFVANVL